jgi:hypothetical protein
MSVVDLHPEELLDKDERGELTTDERARLDVHLDRCAACRAEVVLRADFAAELDGEDRPSALLDLVKGALAAPRPITAPPPAVAATPTTPSTPAMAAAAAPGGAPAAHDAPRAAAPGERIVGPEALAGVRRRPRRTAIVLLVAAAVMAASAAGATGLTGRMWLGLRGGSQEVTHPAGGSLPAATAPAAGGPAALGAPRGGVAPVASVESAAMPDPSEAPAPTADEPVPAAVAMVTTATATATAAAATAATSAGFARTAPRAAVVVPPAIATAATSPPARVAPAAMPSSAEALFDSANAARRNGDTSTALARYDALDQQFPHTAEARLAKATTGKLLLDRGDAAGALSRFDAYLASGASELREEAMAGRATALERLGRRDDEVRAWAALLAAYPATPYAVHAKTRVGRSLGR